MLVHKPVGDDSIQEAVVQFFFGFRVIRPVGKWVVAGPYERYEAAKVAYYNSKASDCELSPPFPAESKAAAAAILMRHN